MSFQLMDACGYSKAERTDLLLQEQRCVKRFVIVEKKKKAIGSKMIVR